MSRNNDNSRKLWYWWHTTVGYPDGQELLLMFLAIAGTLTTVGVASALAPQSVLWQLLALIVGGVFGFVVSTFATVVLFSAIGTLAVHLRVIDR